MQLDSSNMEIISYQKQFQIAKLYLKETKLAYSPNLSLHAGYYFSLTDNSAGNILKNNSFGPQVIGAFSIPIFSAGENKRKISIAGINLYSAECDLQNQKMKIVVEFQTALNEFENQQKLLEIEEENNLLTRENYEICIQRLKYGQTTSLEVHIAQDLYVQSVTRLVNFQYNLKMAEIKLRQLTADL
jgi:outer membrane protein TolC